MLTMKDVIREGHPTLEMKANEVEIPLTDENKETLKLMMEFLENSQNPEISEEYEIRPGVGLAAPQINISKRMIAVLTTDEKNEKLYKLLLVNPKIISHSVKKVYIPGGEGCLSVDRETEGITARHKKITVRAHLYNPETDELKKVEIRVSGYVAVVLQHEIDHLDGILFTTKLNEHLPDAEPIIFPEPEIENEEEN
jgi:peptide deformylase